MSSPKLETGPTICSLLLDVPPETLSAIIFFLPAMPICYLRLCGNRLLNHRMSLPGVVKALHFERYDWTRSSCPNFGSLYPGLLEFTMDVPYTMDSWGPLRAAPATLLSLDIVPSERVPLSRTSPDTLLPLVPNLTHLSIDLQHGWMPEWTEFLPKTLTSLKLSEWDANQPMPESLRYLECSLALMDKEQAMVPSKLETLKIEHWWFDLSALLPFLPMTLTHLSLPLWSGDEYDESIISQLPRQLRMLSVPKLLDRNQGAPAFPSSLTSLFTQEIPRSFLQYLPRSMKEFTIEPLDPLNPLDAEIPDIINLVVPHLPSLTSLQVIGVLEISVPALEPFMVHLTSLKAPGLNISPSDVSLLPRHMKVLSLKYMDLRHIAALPPYLTELTTASLRLCPRGVKRLPKTLRGLFFDLSPMDHRVCEDEAPVNHQESGSSLDVKDGEFNEPYEAQYQLLCDEIGSGLCTFPAVLTHMRASSLPCAPPHLLAAIPRDIIELSLTGCIDGQFLDHIFPVGRLLTTLNIEECPNVTGACFKALSRCLKTLKLCGAKLIEDEFIKDLPRALLNLFLPDSVKLTHECLKFLPRRLCVVNFAHNKNFVAAHVSLLPAFLRSANTVHSFQAHNLRVEGGVVKSKA